VPVDAELFFRRLHGPDASAPREPSPPGPARPVNHRQVLAVVRGQDAPRVAGVKSDKLYLVGFMGAGKTTVARALGHRLGWRVEDVDLRIEAAERRSVAAIFAQAGEPYFRQAERQVLGELLPTREVVIATGGGTFAEPDNRALMLADGAVAWLDVPLSRVLQRVPADGRRPLASDRTQMELLFARRQLAYAEAHVRIDASGRVADVVERLLDWIGY
jgi:shikimate kinase